MTILLLIMMKGTNLVALQSFVLHAYWVVAWGWQDVIRPQGSQGSPCSGHIGLWVVFHTTDTPGRNAYSSMGNVSCNE